MSDEHPHTHDVTVGNFSAKPHGRFRFHIWIQYGPCITILTFLIYVHSMFHFHPLLQKYMLNAFMTSQVCPFSYKVMSLYKMNLSGKKAMSFFQKILFSVTLLIFKRGNRFHFRFCRN